MKAHAQKGLWEIVWFENRLGERKWSNASLYASMPAPASCISISHISTNGRSKEKHYASTHDMKLLIIQACVKYHLYFLVDSIAHIRIVQWLRHEAGVLDSRGVACRSLRPWQTTPSHANNQSSSYLWTRAVEDTPLVCDSSQHDQLSSEV